MRKITVFVPLLLLAIQPNKTLRADAILSDENNAFNEAKARIENMYAYPHEWEGKFSADLPIGIDGLYWSNNPQVNELLELSLQKGEEARQGRTYSIFGWSDDRSTYFEYHIQAIKKYFPHEKIMIGSRAAGA